MRKLRSIGLAEGAIAVVGLAPVALLFFATRLTTGTVAPTSSWERAFGRIGTTVSVSHVWLEEALSGDETIDVPRQVYANIGVARRNCLGLLGRANGTAGVERVGDRRLQEVVIPLCERLDEFAVLARGRWVNRERVGSKGDQAYDAAFDEILRLVATGTEETAQIVARGRSRLDRINGGVIVLLLALFAGMAAVVRRHARQLKRLADRQSSILNAAGDGIYELGADGRILFANEAAVSMTGYDAGTLTGSGVQMIQRREGTACLRDGVARHNIEDVYWRKDGTSFPVEFTSAPIKEGRDVHGVVVVFRNIAERREVERLKDEFVATVTHELRTPLTSIRGYLELVREGEAGEVNADQDRLLAVVDRNAERLLSVVNDLLFVASAEAGKIVLELGEVDLRARAAESVEAARPHAVAKDIELELTGETLDSFRGDAVRLSQLLDNLISNALKFTPPGGRVEVNVSREAGRAVLEVSDTGMGIAEAEQEHLFERFFRASAASEHAIQGTGLGLTIVKAIAEAHGGSISFTSEEGKGTTFRVELAPRLSAREIERPERDLVSA